MEATRVVNMRLTCRATEHAIIVSLQGQSETMRFRRVSQ